MSNLVSTSRHFRRHYTCFLIKQATTLADTTRQKKAVFKKNIPTFKQNTTIQERGKIAGLRRPLAKAGFSLCFTLLHGKVP